MVDYTFDEFIIYDIEVTGFSLDPNVVVQFAARKYKHNQLIDKLDILINNPESLLVDKFKKRTRLNENIIARIGITPNTAIYKIIHFIGNLPLISYKGSYFYDRILAVFLQKELTNLTIDIIDFAKQINSVGNPDDVTLAELAYSLNLDFDEQRWHNASYDVIILEKIWFKLKAIAKNESE